MIYEQNDRFDCLIRLALLDCGKKDVEMFESIDDSDVFISPRLHRRVKRLIRIKAHESRRKKTKLIISRVAVAVLLFMSITIGVLLSVSATRDAIFNAIIEWYENYFTVQYQTPSQDNGNDKTHLTTGEASDVTTVTEEVEPTHPLGSSDVQNTTQPIPSSPPTEIKEIKKPAYLPEGAEEEIVVQNKIRFAIEYYIGDDLILVFNQTLLNDDKKYYDSENAITEEVNINGFSGLLVTYEQKANVYLMWSDNEYVYNMQTDILDNNELIQIARGVN